MKLTADDLLIRRVYYSRDWYQFVVRSAPLALMQLTDGESMFGEPVYEPRPDVIEAMGETTSKFFKGVPGKQKVHPRLPLHASCSGLFTCRVCGAQAVGLRGLRLDLLMGGAAEGLCSQRCAKTVERERQRLKAAALYVPHPAVDRKLKCAHCGGTFTSTRTVARFCSVRCRVAAHRTHSTTAA